MSKTFRTDLSLLLLRVSTGSLMFLHGLYKLQNGHDKIGSMLVSAGLPEYIKYGVPVGEVVAPILMILGFFTVPSALIIAFTMMASIYLVFWDKLFTLSQNGGWVIELNALYLVACLAIALMGPGKFSLGKGKLS